MLLLYRAVSESSLLSIISLRHFLFYSEFIILSSGCIGGCDTILRELTEICGRGPRNNAGAGMFLEKEIWRINEAYYRG